MSWGRLCSQKKYVVTRSAVSWAVGSLGKAIKCTALEKRSITVRMVGLSCEGVRPVTKSKAIWNQVQLGTGKGCGRPASGRCEALLLVHTVQELMKALVSASMVGHQKRRFSRPRVQLQPGWQANSGAVTPLEDLRRYRVREKQTTRKTITWISPDLLRFSLNSHALNDVPEECDRGNMKLTFQL